MRAGQGGGTLSLSDVLKALRARRGTLILGTLLGLGLAAASSFSTVHQYVSSTQLFVSAVGQADNPISAYQGELLSHSRVASYARILTGRQLAQDVVDDLHLPLTASEVATKITATSIPETVLINVTVTDTSPQRAHDIAASLGRQFVSRVPDLDSTKGSNTGPVSVRISEPADFNPTAVTPHVPSDLLRGALLGLVAGVVIAALRTRLDNTVRTAEDVGRATGLNLVGSVFSDSRLAKRPTSPALDGQSPGAEAYRTIRMGLRHVGDDPPRVIVVTSALPGEGKTTVALNLALSIAQSGSRVTLIDANLRRPRVAKYLALEELGGLTDVLSGSAEVRDVAQPWGDGFLTVLGAGAMPGDPGGMLGSQEMRALLKTLRDTEEYVIIDSPPLLPVVDAAMLSGVADGCLVVARFGKTKQDQLAEAVDTVARVRSSLLGVVLNRVPKAAAAGRSGSYSYSHDRDRRRIPRRVRIPSREPVPDGRRTLGAAGSDLMAATQPPVDEFRPEGGQK